MDPGASGHKLQSDRDHQPDPIASAPTMEVTCDRVKPAEDDAEMADLPAAVPTEAQLVGALPPQSKQTNNTNNQYLTPASHVPVDIGTDSEQVHISHVAHDFWIDTDAGDQDSEVDSDGSGSESEEEVQGSDVDSDVDGNNEASNAVDPDEQSEPADVLYEQFLLDKAPTYPWVHHDPNDDNTSIFVDFDDGTDVDTENDSTGDASESEVDVTNDFLPNDFLPAVPYKADTPYILDKHARQQLTATSEPLQLEGLLRSSSTPGRGLYQLERALDYEKHHVAELERMKQYIEAGLRAAQSRQDKLRSTITAFKSSFSEASATAGISDELWQEYEAFCESLEPQFGSRGGWSITCFEDHGCCYIEYDPDFELFVQSAEMNLGSCNFRCEASVETTSFEKDEYVVEFWPLASPEPHVGDENTWGEQYPNLYSLATLAANHPTGRNGSIAQELLRSLPDQYSSFSGGWLFEYHPEPARANHPVKSRQWSYRSAHMIDVPDDQEQVEGSENVDGDGTVKTELTEEQQVGLMMDME